MRDTNDNEIKIGARVMLTKPKQSYTIGRNNPQVGTRWECEGIYMGAGTVKWDNGSQNGYHSDELTLTDGCISIWNEKWH